MPLSLFQNSDYGLKIIDFGLAQELGDSGVVDISKLQGTIEFMSPEVRMTMTMTLSKTVTMTETITMIITMTETMSMMTLIMLQVMNCKTASTRSDMWSAGVVSYMLLTGGKSPFYDGSR